MSNLHRKGFPRRWLAGLALLAAGFLAGVIITTGGGESGTRLGAAIATSESTAAAPAPPAADELRSYADIAALTMPSVVNISTDKVVSAQEWVHPFMDDPFFRRFFGDPGNRNRERVERSLGSGVIVREDGYILTSNHVIERASKIRVLFNDNMEYQAEIVGQDPQTDVALIKIDAKGLPALPIGSSGEMRIGDQVMAIGNPFGVGQTVTVGIVSALGRSEIGLIDYEDFIQTDASINPGNSGGALVNMRGELIGVNTAILSRSGGSQGIGFAIPTDMARQVMDSLIEHGKVVRAWLGVQIQPVTPAMAQSLKLERPRGVLVAEVTAGAPADKAGVKEGDIITAVDGAEVNDRGRLRNLISLAGVGKTVRLSMLRDGKTMETRVKLEELPENPQVARGGRGAEREVSGGLEGVTVRELNEQRRRMLNLDAGVQGVVVVSVAPASNAAREGLRENDIIMEIFKEPVRGLADYEKLLARDKDKPALLRVYRDGSRLFLAIPR